jgi:glycosyltransferase involved in cell wall biosynthesis
MRILFVSMRSSHFFGWLEHLKNSKHEIWWLDVYDGGKGIDKYDWIYQITNWKRRWDFPGRQRLKNWPWMYNVISKINYRKLDVKFSELLKEIKPDVVHSFAMQVSCKPIIAVMERYSHIPWIYSSWGSDVFMSNMRYIDNTTFLRIIKRVTHHISDCDRDRTILKTRGFEGISFDIIPGNGGIKTQSLDVDSEMERDTILIKGYDDIVGRGLIILEAINALNKALLEPYKLVIYGASQRMEDFTSMFKLPAKFNIRLIPKTSPLGQKELFTLMNRSILHIGNSISDGMPNAMLEAIAHGVFPIQSNPGGATSEIIVHNVNGLLINNPESPEEIKELIILALKNKALIENARAINYGIILEQYDWNIIHTKILNIYKSMFEPIET